MVTSVAGARLYDIEIRHVRATPVRHDIAYRTHWWLVDLDDLPVVPFGLASFEARDHLGDPGATIRANVDALLYAHGIATPARITMLTSARSLGYVFNPLSVFWAHDDTGTITAVIAEVHNTYQDRHAYVVRTDDAGRGQVEKDFYVSPFYDVTGSYTMSLPEPQDTLAITVTLHRDGEPPFVASVRGSGRSATRRAVASALLRDPLVTRRARVAITAHGLRLWAKRLPIADRPAHDPGPLVGSPALQHTTPNERPSAMPTTAEKLTAIVKDVAGVDLPVRIRAWDGSEAGPADAPIVVVRNRRALRRLLFAPGEMGLARAYVTGDLDVVGSDAPGGGAVLEDGFRRIWALAREQDVQKPTAKAVAKAAASVTRLGVLGRPPKRPASEAVLNGRLHTRGRDRAAISHHYDLSNDFYRLILDPKMAYSCAYYPDPNGSEATDGYTVADAQRDKLDLVCRKLDLQPGIKLLDIGCGWGSMILHAAEHYGVTAVGVTLSAQQRDEIEKRIAEKGLADKVTVRLQHYREFAGDSTFEQGGFDAVSSLEMGEHVGEEHYPDYTQMMFDALKPGGRLLLQQMSRHAGTAPGGGAFIESYIAPDMHMRPLPQTMGFVEGAGFEIRDVEAMREHYVRTVRDWIATFETNRDEAIRLVGEEGYRVWQLYLVGGAMAFDENRMGVDQILGVKADAAGVASMPGRRPWALPAD